MTDLTYAAAIEAVYASIQADNAELDSHIAALEAAMARERMKEAVVEPARQAQNNRQGRKLMQAYFRQRGVKVTFAG